MRARKRRGGVWVTLLPFAVVFAALLHSDLTTERDMLERKPAGH